MPDNVDPMIPNEWFFLDSGPNDGTFNMQCDERLAGLFQDGEIRPTVRLYQWSPWAISLGYNQHHGDVDVEAAARHGVDLVRRPTGGRAILHAEELTYSVVMPASHDSIHAAYHRISQAVVRGLSLMGAEVGLVRSQPNFARAYRQPSSIPCFSSSARYEIEWHGRKLVGSAQRRYGNAKAVLQHGSILAGPAHRELVKFLKVESAGLRNELTRDIEERTTDLSEVLGKNVDMVELSECIKQGFALEWGITFLPAPPSLTNVLTHVHA